jgi:predicted transcriptional regulator YdeE
MKNRKTKAKEKKIVGISIQTSYMLETNPETAKIEPTLNQYFGNNLAEKITARKNPGTTYCVYTKYDSDEKGPYTYFVGEEVDSFDNIDPDFDTLSIPDQTYSKFTIGPGQMPDICIEAWMKIWQMDNSDLGGDRTYVADFEIYDKRAKDPSQTTLDIYIGIRGNN